MAFLKTHRVETKKQFLNRGKIDIPDGHIQNLNNEITEAIKKKDDEQIRIIDKTGLLDKPFR